MMEALLRAEQSSDLSDVRDTNGISDIDFIRAAGMVAQTHPVAMAIWRLTDLGELRAARAVFDGLVRRLVYMGHDSDPTLTAARVLDWMMHPTCTHCDGRGYEKAPGAPVLTAEVCAHCGGTGKRPKDWDDAAHDLHEWILGDQRQAAAAILRKLKDD